VAAEDEGIFQSLGYMFGDVAVPFGTLYTRRMQIHIGRTHAAALLPEVLALIDAGRLDPSAVTTRVVGRDEARRAHDGVGTTEPGEVGDSRCTPLAGRYGPA
jgi:threonine dehydrogenase-like Zn-dependent dehydrogenase